MPAQGHQSNNCCTVSNADQSQPALVNGLAQNPDHLKQTGRAQIELPIYWRIVLGQPAFPSLEVYRHRLSHFRDLPTLVCSLLM